MGPAQYSVGMSLTPPSLPLRQTSASMPDTSATQTLRCHSNRRLRLLHHYLQCSLLYNQFYHRYHHPLLHFPSHRRLPLMRHYQQSSHMFNQWCHRYLYLLLRFPFPHRSTEMCIIHYFLPSTTILMNQHLSRLQSQSPHPLQHQYLLHVLRRRQMILPGVKEISSS